MKRIEKISKKKINLLLVLVMFVLARISCPALSNIPIFNMAFTFLYGTAFVGLYLLTDKRMQKKDFYLMLSAFGYALYIFIRGFAVGESLFARDAFNAYVIVFLTMIYIWVREKPADTKAFLFKLILACLIFDYVYSIVVLFFDPDASRKSAAIGVLEKSPYDVLNAVGSFDAVYGGLSVIVILLCMRRMMKERDVKSKATLLVLILAFVFIIMASYGTSLVLLVVALALYLMRRNQVLSLLMLAAVSALLVWHEPIGAWIVELSSRITYSEALSDKMNDIGYMLQTLEATGTYAGENGRAARMLWSWNTFTQHPLFGGLGIEGAKIGGHSEFFDLLGRFGLVGFAALTAYFVCLYRNVCAELPSKSLVTCWRIILAVFIASAVLNPSLYALQMMPMILMISLTPAYVEACESKQKERKES